MIKFFKGLFRKRNNCITIMGRNREVVRIKRVKETLSLQDKTSLSKYFIGAKSIAPIEKNYLTVV